MSITGHAWGPVGTSTATLVWHMGGTNKKKVNKQMGGADGVGDGGGGTLVKETTRWVEEGGGVGSWHMGGWRGSAQAPRATAVKIHALNHTRDPHTHPNLPWAHPHPHIPTVLRNISLIHIPIHTYDPHPYSHLGPTSAPSRRRSLPSRQLRVPISSTGANQFHLGECGGVADERGTPLHYKGRHGGHAQPEPLHRCLQPGRLD